MYKIEDVISRLRKLYPDLTIISWEKNNRGNLIVNDKTIFKYDQDFMNQQLTRLGKEGFDEITKIWAEYVEIRYIKRINRFDKKPAGRPGLNLTESQIKYAMANTKSNSAAARFLNVKLDTYKKYASMYGLYDIHKNRQGKGIYKSGRYPPMTLQAIFENKHPSYSIQKLKNRIISELILEERCAICGYNERRIYDNKVALALDFIDGNKKNMSKENLRLLCYNCTFNVRGKVAKAELRKFLKEHENYDRTNSDKKQEDLFNKFNEESHRNVFNNPIVQSNEKENATNNENDIWDKFNS